MANVTMVVTTAGLNALSAKIGAGQAFVLDRIKLGIGQYTPAVGATDVVTPFSPVREFASLSGSVSGNQVSFEFQDEGDAAYDVGEIGVFSGTTLFAIASQLPASGFVFSKSMDTPLLVSIHNVWSDVGSISSITFSSSPHATAATYSVMGLVKLSTDDKADIGTGDEVITNSVLKHITDNLIIGGSVTAAQLPTVPVSKGGTGATSVAGARANLGLGTGTALNVGTGPGNLAVLGSNSKFSISLIPSLPASIIGSGILAIGRLPTISVSKGGTGATSATGARSNLGLGSAATRNAGTGSGNVPTLNSNGQLSAAHIPDLSANKVTSGRLGFNRMPSNVRIITSGTADPNDNDGQPNGSLYVQRS